MSNPTSTVPFVPFPNVLLAEMRMQLAGQQVENTLYFEPVGGGGTPDPVALGAALETWWYNSYAQNLSNTLQLVEVYLTDLSSQEAPTYTYVPASATTGQNPSPALPNNVSIAVSFRTAGRGRSGRGRNFVVGLVDAAVDHSTLQGNYGQQLVAAYNALPGDVASSGYRWVVASRQHNKAFRETGVTYPVTAALLVDYSLDSQRRRLPGRGK